MELLLKLSQGEGRSLVDKLHSIFPKVNFEILTVVEVIKTAKHCSQITSRRSDGYVMNAVFAQEFVYVEIA